MPIERGGLEIIAGPCSITSENLREIYQIAGITVTNLRGESQRAVFGTRVVGLKSRTSLDSSGDGMGIDYRYVMENMLILEEGGRGSDLLTPPSVDMSQRIAEDTDMMVATEVMLPNIQVPVYERKIPPGKLLLWNPSVDQLGWHLVPMARAAARNDWQVGIKNGKWQDMERTWTGLAKYVSESGLPKENLVLIHRGVDIPNKGNYRNYPVHDIAHRAKHTTGARLYFDPSHSFGPELRDHIVDRTIEAMLLEDGNDWLYDGVLIEVGTSQTDTDQHITIDELDAIVHALAPVREIKSPTRTKVAV